MGSKSSSERNGKKVVGRRLGQHLPFHSIQTPEFVNGAHFSTNILIHQTVLAMPPVILTEICYVWKNGGITALFKIRDLQ